MQGEKATGKQNIKRANKLSEISVFNLLLQKTYLPCSTRLGDGTDSRKEEKKGKGEEILGQ